MTPAKPREVVRCPRCNSIRLKQTKTVVILGKVPVFCLLCGLAFDMPVEAWRRRTQGRPSGV